MRKTGFLDIYQRNMCKYKEELYLMYKQHTLAQFSMFYYHMQIEDIVVLVFDNEYLYMDKNIDNDMHQLMINQNKEHHFHKVKKHIEIQLEILLY